MCNSHLFALDGAQLLVDGQRVRHYLDRVVVVCQPIDDRAGAVLCQLQDVLRKLPRQLLVAVLGPLSHVLLSYSASVRWCDTPSAIIQPMSDASRPLRHSDAYVHQLQAALFLCLAHLLMDQPTDGRTSCANGHNLETSLRRRHLNSASCATCPESPAWRVSPGSSGGGRETNLVRQQASRLMTRVRPATFCCNIREAAAGGPPTSCAKRRAMMTSL